MILKGFWIFTLALLVHSSILRLPQCGKFAADFSIVKRSHRLKSFTIRSIKRSNIELCQLACFHHQNCKSINFNLKNDVCDLNNNIANITDTSKSIEKLQRAPNWVYIEAEQNPRSLGPTCMKTNPCNGLEQCIDTCDHPGYHCVCHPAYRVGGPKCTVATNRALHRNAAQITTSREGGVLRSASIAVDGEHEKFFSSTKEDKVYNWWQVDMGSAIQIHDVVVYNRNDCCSWRLRDGYATISMTSNFETSQLCYNFTYAIAKYSFECESQPAVGRYFRINHDKMRINVREVEIYGWPVPYAH